MLSVLVRKDGSKNVLERGTKNVLLPRNYDSVKIQQSGIVACEVSNDEFPIKLYDLYNLNGKLLFSEICPPGTDYQFQIGPDYVKSSISASTNPNEISNTVFCHHDGTPFNNNSTHHLLRSLTYILMGDAEYGKPGSLYELYDTSARQNVWSTKDIEAELAPQLQAQYSQKVFDFKKYFCSEIKAYSSQLLEKSELAKKYLELAKSLVDDALNKYFKSNDRFGSIDYDTLSALRLQTDMDRLLGKSTPETKLLSILEDINNKMKLSAIIEYAKPTTHPTIDYRTCKATVHISSVLDKITPELAQNLVDSCDKIQHIKWFLKEHLSPTESAYATLDFKTCEVKINDELKAKLAQEYAKTHQSEIEKELN